MNNVLAKLKKYWRPTSVTWWTGMVTFLGGLFIALEPVHGLAPLTQAAENVFGGVPASVLIVNGLLGIGLRAAIK